MIGVACAGHQAWSANVYSVVGDLFPKTSVATVTGIAQFAGGIGSFAVNKASGMMFTVAANRGASFSFCGFDGKPAGYMVVFCWCAVAYLLAWVCMKILVRSRQKPSWI